MADSLVVADTDYVIDFLRGGGPGAPSVRRWLREQRLRLTAVTAFELRLGTDFLARRGAIDLLLGGRTLPLDTRAALLAGEVFAELEAQGRGIGIKDCLQAGVCRRFDLPLATRNSRHYRRIDGLRLFQSEGDGEPEAREGAS